MLRSRLDVQPDRNTEYFLYQTMIGAWPIERDRLTTYMEKAIREAKQQTSWTQQNKEFEDALEIFIERLYGSTEFISSIDEFVSRIISARKSQQSRTNPAEMHRAGSSGHLSGERVVGSSPCRS